MLDEIDIEILKKIEADPNKPLINYLKPFSHQRTLSRLYAKAKNLEVYGLIVKRRTSRVALVSITVPGKQAIKGRGTSHPEGGASL